MTRTTHAVLRDLNARLDLPARRRALLLRELRADFEDLVATLEAEGLTPEAAEARALELLSPTEEDAGALAGLHRSSYARIAERLAPGHVRLIERAGIGAMAALAALAPVMAVAYSTRLAPLTLVVLGCVALPLFAHLAWQAFRIVVRGDADAASLARAGTIQAGLVGLTVAAGALVVVTEAYVAAAALSTGGGIEVGGVVGAMTRCADAAALTLGLTILGVFGALALHQWHVAARAVEEELIALLAPVSPSSQE